MNLWKRLGLQIHLSQDTSEQKFVNSLATFSSSWLRIKFVNDEVYTNDPFQGKTGFLFFICLETSSLWRFRVIEIITLRVQLLKIFKKCLTRNPFELFKKIKHFRTTQKNLVLLNIIQKWSFLKTGKKIHFQKKITI